MTIEQVPDIPMFRQNAAGFIHDLLAGSLSNVDGDANYVRIQVLTNAGALDRGKQPQSERDLRRLLSPRDRPASRAPGRLTAGRPGSGRTGRYARWRRAGLLQGQEQASTARPRAAAWGWEGGP
jgi:hypothetical protein